MLSIDTTLQNLHRNLYEVYELLRKPVVHVLENHRFHNHENVKKIVNYIERYHHVLFWAVHGWNWYFYPLSFYAGFVLGIAGNMAYQGRFSTYDCKIIHTSRGMKEYPYALVVMSLFFTSLSLSFFDGFATGGYVTNFGSLLPSQPAPLS